MSHILVVEDEPSMLMGLRDNLEFEGYQVDHADEGHLGLQKILSGNYDLVLLDVMLPNLSGFDICRAVRKKGLVTPIILLTARGEELDKVRGLELGADDYITKPFSLRELLARVKAVLRRMNHHEAGHDFIKSRVTIGRLDVDFSAYNAKIDGQEARMSHKEFEILQYLCQHGNKIVSRDELLENVWGYHEQPTTRTVDNFMVKLRQKIEQNPNDPKRIITVHGVGYKLLY